MKEEDQIEFAAKLRAVESLTKTAGVPLNMSKTRFIFDRETLVKLIMAIQHNEYCRGQNNELCCGCQKKIEAHMGRGFGEPNRTWAFCSKCPVKKLLKK